MKRYIFLVFIFLSTITLKATLITSVSNGDWNDASTWDLGVPGDDDQVKIEEGHSVTLIESEILSDITIEVGGNLILDTGIQLILSGSSSILLLEDASISTNATLLGALFTNIFIIEDIDAVIDDINDILTGGGDLLSFITANLPEYNGTSGDFDGPATITDGSTSGSLPVDYIPLPIELITFNAYKINNSVGIFWQTATELNNDYFIIERSGNGVSYETIATVSGAGNSSSILDYSFIDNNPINGMSYYRLTQTDYDGRFETFDAVSINRIQDFQEVKVGPNPTSDYIYINLASDFPEGTIQLYNTIGALVKNINIDANKITIDVTDLNSGAYIVIIRQQNTTINKQIVIQN